MLTLSVARFPGRELRVTLRRWIMAATTRNECVMAGATPDRWITAEAPPDQLITASARDREFTVTATSDPGITAPSPDQKKAPGTCSSPAGFSGLRSPLATSPLGSSRLRSSSALRISYSADATQSQPTCAVMWAYGAQSLASYTCLPRCSYTPVTAETSSLVCCIFSPPQMARC